VIGQRLELDRAVLACRVVEPLRVGEPGHVPDVGEDPGGTGRAQPRGEVRWEVAAGRPEC